MAKEDGLSPVTIGGRNVHLPGPGAKGHVLIERGARKSVPDAASILKGLDHLLRVWELNRQHRLRGVNGGREDRLRGLFGGG